MWARLKGIFGWISSRLNWRIGRRILLGLFIFLFFYYLVGMALIQNINDDQNFGHVIAEENVAGGGLRKSHAVAVSIALIDREINTHSWITNDPPIMPGYMLDNMAHYQQGIISALAILAVELKDQLGRNRGSSQTDNDLKEYASAINYAPNKWYWVLTAGRSEKQYAKALEKLISYEQRLEKGEAVFDKRADNLMATLDKVALDLGSSSDRIAKKIHNGIGCVFDTKADDLFYEAKGRAYAYSLVLKGLRRDFEQIISDREIAASWDLMEQSLSSLINLDPMVVANCDADGFLFQNHLGMEGFYLLRARTQLKEITNILVK